jgi:FkbM family methyltransferase
MRLIEVLPLLEVERQWAWSFRVGYIDLAYRILSSLGRPVRFLEIGANDGRTSDRIFPMVVHFGWQGVAVEPVPSAFQELKRTYADRPVQCVRVAIDSKPGYRNLYTSNVNSRLSSFHEDVILRDVHQRDNPGLADCLECIRTPTNSVVGVLQECGLTLQDIDVIQVDAEGHDADIISQLQPVDRRPGLIVFEYAHLKDEQVRACREHLEPQGYYFIDCGVDFLLIQADFQINLPIMYSG